MRIAKQSILAAIVVASVCALSTTGAPAQESRTVASSYVFDASWPKLPLPNKWTFGGVTGLAVDNDDH